MRTTSKLTAALLIVLGSSLSEAYSQIKVSANDQIGIGSQYDTTHVYVAPADVDAFVKSFLWRQAVFGRRAWVCDPKGEYADLADAFLGMYLFETVCTIQVRAMAGGSELINVDPRIIAGAQAQSKEVTKGVGGGALAWPGLLRKLDRADPSYRT